VSCTVPESMLHNCALVLFVSKLVLFMLLIACSCANCG